MPQSPPEFLEWFKKRVEERGWNGPTEIGRGIGVTHPTISAVLAGEQPSFDTCIKIADGLLASRRAVVFMAGLLPPPPDYSVRVDEWDSLYDELSENDREEMLAMGRVKAIRGKREKEKTS